MDDYNLIHIENLSLDYDFKKFEDFECREPYIKEELVGAVKSLNDMKFGLYIKENEDKSIHSFYILSYVVEQTREDIVAKTPAVEITEGSKFIYVNLLAKNKSAKKEKILPNIMASILLNAYDISKRIGGIGVKLYAISDDLIEIYSEYDFKSIGQFNDGENSRNMVFLWDWLKNK